MDKANKISSETSATQEKFDAYIDLWVKFRPTVADKVLFCVHRGFSTPRALCHRLQIAKGNLANCCKKLISDGCLVQHTNGRAVEYELTAGGTAQISKFLGKEGKWQ